MEHKTNPAEHGSTSSSSKADIQRILHISDTHNLLTPEVIEKMPAADILIHTGDFTEYGTSKECESFNKLLAGPLKAKYPVRVVIAGNHDLWEVGDDHKRLRSRLSAATHVLIHEQVEVNGLKIYGCPWWHGHHWDYKETRQGKSIKLRNTDPAGFGKIPYNLDVLLTHGPPRGVLDEADGVKGFHSGSVDLAKSILRTAPKLCLWGHVHEQRGTALVRTGEKREQKTTCVNSAMADRWEKPKQLQSGKVRPAGEWCGAHLIIASRRKGGGGGSWDFKIAQSA
mmetsp:Transcript_28606/g.69753  ORF Transcript_28606/g.69753 Transcript_28606/m.69753 type:complete len:283 (-) Transcript_28606:62-910(-)|eukprot:CAMPEP_0114488112 /NCGR_PEP_ID=MMETSP0109-20121206/1143_1 /TAXON_ID=29199 /ORGANISM="Chlorarachnion reptans, Strain CCCM449" /LENGTH=282 /DNA_ID=CAMNT_0001664457 /DNA_START=94 /DNA_END=942 /DNA_ORIENTATION=+